MDYILLILQLCQQFNRCCEYQFFIISRGCVDLGLRQTSSPSFAASGNRKLRNARSYFGRVHRTRLVLGVLETRCGRPAPLAIPSSATRTRAIPCRSVSLIVGDSYSSSSADQATVTVISLEDAAQGQVADAINEIGQLVHNVNVQSPGLQQMLSNNLTDAVTAIQEGNIALALQELFDVLVRTDGCRSR